MPDATSEERLGTTLAGKYRLDRILGEGGMGVVFAGMHLGLRVPVAIKFLHPQFSQSTEVVQRFVREAQAAARLSHPNVVSVRDVDTAPDGSVYMVLELLEGESLADHLERVGKLSPTTALSFIEPAMDALAVAHAAGIVHRDIKPDNLFLSRGLSGALIPKVLDFGIAKLAEAASPSATSTGAVLGTPAYMPPEQAMGSKDLGPPADVWSMAVVLYQCLSGHMHIDFPSETNAMGVVLAVVNDTPIPLAQRCPELPTAVARVVDRALSKDPAERYPSMREFLTALRATHDETLIVGTPLPGEATPSRPAKSDATARPLAKTLILADVALTSGSLGVSQGAQPPRAALRIGVSIVALLVLALGFGVVGAMRAPASTAGPSAATGAPEPITLGSAESREVTNPDPPTPMGATDPATPEPASEVPPPPPAEVDSRTRSTRPDVRETRAASTTSGTTATRSVTPQVQPERPRTSQEPVSVSPVSTPTPPSPSGTTLHRSGPMTADDF